MRSLAISPAFEAVIPWVKKGGFAILDQALFSGANFLVNILLARWLPPREYGAFAVAYSIFLFISGFYNALLLEPMSVLGPANHKTHFKEYLGLLLWIHWGLTLGLVIILLLTGEIISFFSPRNLLIGAFIGLSIASSFMLLLWFARRGFYIQQKPIGAFKGSALYGGVLLLGLIWFKKLEIISPFIAFVIMGIAGTIASVFMLCTLKPRFGIACLLSGQLFKSLLIENWRYGKWVVATTFVYWLSGNVYYVFIPFFLGFAETGALRALQNLILPMGQVTTALGLLLLPWVSRRFSEKGIAVIKRDVLKISILLMVLTGIYSLFLLMSGKILVQILYKGKYTQFFWLLPYLLVTLFMSNISNGFRIGLKAIQFPKAIFISYCIGAFTTVFGGTILVSLLGLKGVAFGYVLSNSVITLVAILYWINASQKIQNDNKSKETPIWAFEKI